MYHSRMTGPLSALLFLIAAGCGKPETETSQSPATTTAPAEASAAPGAPALLQRAQAMFKPLPESMEAPGRPLTSEKIALGRQLYYEKRLSRGHDLSCNGCHDLNAYGTDSRAGASGKFSQGHKGQLGGRNSPSSYNAALHVAQFWDGRATDVEAQAKGPVLNPLEMALPDATSAVKTLKSIPGYKPLFRAAFPDEADPITFDNVTTAIGAFERKLVTRDRFDKFLQGDTSVLTDTELKGLAAFMDTGCIACHNGAGIGGGMYQKLGLLKPYPSTDAGRFEVTKNEADKHVFKVPSLRNIAMTAPYFHDGSQATLSDAVRTMAEYQTARGKLSADEVSAIVAFLKALTGELPIEYIKEPTVLAGSKATPKPQS